MPKRTGFSVVELIVVLSLLLIVGLIVWRVYVNQHAPTAPSYTSAPPATSKRIVAVGDIACDPQDAKANGQDLHYCQDPAVAKRVELLKPDAVLGLGDLQYNDGTLAKFQSSYAKSWQQFQHIFYPSPGNHEYATSGARGYFDFFKSAPLDVSRGYYSFTVGEWHVLSLNSNCTDIGGCDQNSPQLQWLRQDLDADKARCTLAFWHHPHFTSGRYMNDENTKSRSTVMWETLVQHHASVVLNGHDHLYERFAPQTGLGVASNNGVRQFTVGTGGKELYGQVGVVANSQKIIAGQFGVLALDVSADAYAWQFVTPDGQVLDSGSQKCSSVF